MNTLKLAFLLGILIGACISGIGSMAEISKLPQVTKGVTR